MESNNLQSPWHCLWFTIGSSFREQNRLTWVSQGWLQSSTKGNGLNVIIYSVIASRVSQFKEEFYFE